MYSVEHKKRCSVKASESESHGLSIYYK